MYLMNFKLGGYNNKQLAIVGASPSKLKKFCLIQFGRLPAEWVIFNRRGETEESSYSNWDEEQREMRTRPIKADIVVW